MADEAVVHADENPPEQVAYMLMCDVMGAENRVAALNPREGYQAADRKYLLDTYAECLLAVRNPETRQNAFGAHTGEAG